MDNELYRLSRRVKLANRYTDAHNGRYRIYTWFNGNFDVCKLTGAVLRHETFSGRIFGSEDVLPEHDRILDDYLDRWDSATVGQHDIPAVTFFPKSERNKLAIHAKAQAVKAWFASRSLDKD